MAMEENGDFRCMDCGVVVHDGQSMWSVNVHREVFVDGAITVHEADCYKLFCDACGRKRDFLHMAIPLKTDSP